MRLTERDGNVVTVHEFLPNHEKIKKYKMEQMSSFPLEIRVLNASTNSIDVLDVKGFETINIKNLRFSQGMFAFFRKYHDISIHKELRKKRDAYLYMKRLNYILRILDNYYYGMYDRESLVRVKDDTTDVFHLLTTGQYVYKNKHSNERNIPDVINLPDSLYILHLLFKEQYGLLCNVDVAEQLELFDYRESKSYNIQTQVLDFKDPDYLIKYHSSIELDSRCVDSDKILRLAKQKGMIQKK